MKFTKKKFPLLHLLKEDADILDKNNNVRFVKGRVPFLNNIEQEMNSIFHRFVEENSVSNVNYVTATIANVFINDRKMYTKLWGMRTQIEDSSGVFILSSGLNIAYDITKYEELVYVTCYVFVFDYWVGYISLGWKISDSNDFFEGNPHLFFLEDLLVLTKDDILTMIVTFELFKKYAKLEVKYVNCKKKKKEVVGKEKLLNQDFGFDINIIDSTWFTTIIRSEGFDVKGHFRLQPCGPGLKDRELIYINPFRKNGYTKTAKKLNQ